MIMTNLITGYFYDEDGTLFHWYAGAEPYSLVDDKEAAVGFIESDYVDSNNYKYDFKEKKLIPFIVTGSIG